MRTLILLRPITDLLANNSTIQTILFHSPDHSTYPNNESQLFYTNNYYAIWQSWKQNAFSKFLFIFNIIF